MKYLTTQLRIAAVLVLGAATGVGNAEASGSVTNLVADTPSITVSVSGRTYQIRRCWVPSSWLPDGARNDRGLFAGVTDSEGHLVSDRNTLEKVFFTSFAYGMNPLLEKPGEGVSNLLANDIQRAEGMANLRMAGDVTLFVRDAASVALVQTAAAYLTGGESLAKTVPVETAKSLVKSVATDPAVYLKAVYSSTLSESVQRLKAIQREYEETKPSSLNYEHARMLFDATAKQRAFVSETSILLNRLLSEQGGPTDLLSQLTKVGETMAAEVIGIIFDSTSVKPVITTADLGKNIQNFLGGNVPLYKDYLERLAALEKTLRASKETSFWKDMIEPSIAAASTVKQRLAEQQKAALQAEIADMLARKEQKDRTQKEAALQLIQDEQAIAEAKRNAEQQRQAQLQAWWSQFDQEARARREQTEAESARQAHEQQLQLAGIKEQEARRAAERSRRNRESVDRFLTSSSPRRLEPTFMPQPTAVAQPAGPIAARIWTSAPTTTVFGEGAGRIESLVVFYSVDRDCDGEVFVEVRKPTVSGAVATAFQQAESMGATVQQVGGRRSLIRERLQAGRIYERRNDPSVAQVLDGIRNQLRDRVAFLLNARNNTPPDVAKLAQEGLDTIKTLRIPVVFSIEVRDASGATGRAETIVYHGL